MRWLFIHCIQIEVEFRKVGFRGQEGNRGTPRKRSWEEGRETTANTTHMTPSVGIEPGPHRWEVRALTQAPSLLP